jgi:hypothetical protein
MHAESSNATVSPFHACTYGCTTLRDVVRDAKSFDEIFHAWGYMLHICCSINRHKEHLQPKRKKNKIKESGFLSFLRSPHVLLHDKSLSAGGQFFFKKKTIFAAHPIQWQWNRAEYGLLSYKRQSCTY